MGDRLISSVKRQVLGRRAERDRREPGPSLEPAGSVAVAVVAETDRDGAFVGGSFASDTETDLQQLDDNMSALSMDEAQTQTRGRGHGHSHRDEALAQVSSKRERVRGVHSTAVTASPKPTKRTQKGNPRRDRGRLLEPGGGDAQEFEQFMEDGHRHRQDHPSEFVSLGDLDNQPKIERDPHHGQFQSTVHRCHKPLHDMKIRVQLLQYPSLGVPTAKDSSGQGQEEQQLAVLEDRIFSWQEKVFSETEVRKYRDKKNLSTDLDHTYHERLKSHPDTAIGNYLYSYIQSDKNFISKKLDKNVTVRRCPAIHLGPNAMEVRTTATGRDSHSDTDFEGEVRDYGDILPPGRGFSAFGQRQRRGEVANRGRGGRQSATITRERKLTSEAATELKDVEAGAAAGHSKGADEDTDSELSESQKSEGKGGGATAKIRTAGSRSRSRPAVSAVRARSTSRSNLKIFGKQSLWDSDQPDPASTLSNIGKPQQVMYIMACLPMPNKKRRKVVVGSIRAYPHAGVILIKPSFGYRNIEPSGSQNFRYRLCWELYTPNMNRQQQADVDEQLLGPDFQSQRIGAGDFHSQKSFDELRRQPSSLMERVGDVFETVPANEFRVQIMGEVLTAAGFENSPLTVHYYLDLPKGWRNEGGPNTLGGVTHSAQVNSNCIAHFSQDFCFQLAFSMDMDAGAADEAETYPTPVLCLMVTSIEPKVIINYEGYAHLPIPSRAGFHSMHIKTWKPRPSTVVERLHDAFVNIGPALKGAHTVYGRGQDSSEETRHLNLVGLQTISSGSISLRLHVIHHSHSSSAHDPHGYASQRERLQLLEKMSSATILKSVQTVIDAFQRARQKASNVTTSNAVY